MYKVFTVPWDEKTESFDQEALDQYLLNKKVLRVEPVFFQQGGKPYWTLFLETENVNDIPAGMDEKSLTPSERKLFEKMREWRKQQAKEDGVAPYVVASNKHLAEIIRRRCKKPNELSNVTGLGHNRISRFGEHLCQMVRVFFQETQDPKKTQDPGKTPEKKQDPGKAPEKDPETK